MGCVSVRVAGCVSLPVSLPVPVRTSAGWPGNATGGGLHHRGPDSTSPIYDRPRTPARPLPAATMVRETRNRKPTNYALDPYEELGGGESDPGLEQPDSADDEDFKVGPRLAAEISVPDAGTDIAATIAAAAADEPTSDDTTDDGNGGLSDDAADPRPPRKARRPTPDLSPGATLEAIPGEGARLHRPHKFRVNRLPGTAVGTRRRDRLAAAAAAAAAAATAAPLPADGSPDGDGDGDPLHHLLLLPAGMRPPDPSVKITYRPGFIKSTGKRERIVTAYGANTLTLVRAVKVRDTFIGLPAIPERASLGFTPFWSQAQDRHVEVGIGQQQTQRIEYYNTPGAATNGVGAGVEKYLPPDTGVIKCIIGPQTGKKIITFQRFGMHDLAGTGKQKRGFILNAGGQVVGMDWAPNRPTGLWLSPAAAALPDC